MVKRIKKYKITLRPSQVLRHLKKRAPITESESELEKNIESEIARIQRTLALSSVYETFSRNELPSTLQELWSKGPDTAVSLSLIATTIGNSIDTEIGRLQNTNTLQLSLLESIGMEAVDQSFTFLTKLLQEESKLEGCECTISQPIENHHTQEVLNALQIQGGEITFNSEGCLTPLYSRLGLVFWNPLKKR